MATLFPPFFRSLAMQAGLSDSAATASWAFTTAAALALLALCAPVLGAIADHTGGIKRYLGACAALGILATAGFVLIPKAGWIPAAILFVAADCGFAGSIVFYESLLPHLARPGDLDRVSARGYAAGYAGGGLLLVLHLLWITNPTAWGMPDRAFAVRAAFASVAVWWAVFSLPFFRGVPEPAGRRHALADAPQRKAHAIAAGLRRLRATLREIRSHRQLFAFLLAFWLYSDGMGTIIKMAAAYGDELGISLADLVRALLLTQFIGVPFSLLSGKLAGRWGARPVLLLGLTVYVGVCVGGFFMRTAAHFYALAALVGIAQGGCQALSRSLFIAMVPRQKTAEFLGFFSTSNRFAGIAGPLAFGVIGHFAGESRIAILALAAFIVGGGVLLARVDLDEGRRRARAAEAPAETVCRYQS